MYTIQEDDVTVLKGRLEGKRSVGVAVGVAMIHVLSLCSCSIGVKKLLALIEASRLVS